MSEGEKSGKLLYWTRVKPLFRGVYEGNETKLNVAGDAVEKIIEYLEGKLKAGIQEIVDSMPKKSKGDHAGELVRKTIKVADVRKAKAAASRLQNILEKAQKEKAKPAKKGKKKKRR
ncbi:MAG: hypothetical protein ACTSRW_06290 [Candidatus Helarchaeota archaeon]